MFDWHRLYQNCPYPLQVAAASARGYYLRWWRYGPDTERLVEEARERETWGPVQWEKWQEDRLSYILQRAVTKVPYYRNYWKGRCAGGSRPWEHLDNWPVIKKETLRSRPEEFVADDCNIKKMFCDRTSGTSGTPLSIYFSRNTLQYYYALYEARIRRWNEIGYREKWAILGGQKVVPVKRMKSPFWVFNSGLNQLYMSTYHLSPGSAAKYVEALLNFAPTHMIVYPSSAAILAAAILEENLTPPRLKAIFGNAEILPDEKRALISKAFRCAVRNTYGMGEMAAAASECARGSLHLWPEVGKVEVFDDERDMPIKNGTGRLILTGFINPDMPLIRYEVGDRGAIDDPGCLCGRTLPQISRLEGRSNDMIITPDGRRIFWLNPAFYGLRIREAQIIQHEVDRIEVLIVPAPGFTPDIRETIRTRLRNVLGDVGVTVADTDRIPRGANGKFRAVISHSSQKII